jgi:hypothetical protein
VVTVSQIITEAFRESNNLAIGQSPTAQEQVEGLTLFNRLVKSVFGSEAGQLLTPINIGSNNIAPAEFATIPSGNWFVPANSKIFFNLLAPQTISLNPSPEDGERFAVQDVSGNFNSFNVTIKANGRTIEGLTQQVLNANGENKEWFYRADTANWQLTSPLTLSSVFPFPEEFEDYFIIGLAMRLNPRSGVQMDGQSIEAYRKSKIRLRARYSQTIEMRPEEGLLRLVNSQNTADFLKGSGSFHRRGWY